MYCEHCGKKIDIDSNFCEHCGTKIQKTVIKPKKELKTKENKVLVIIILFTIFGFLFMWELKYFNSPNSALKTYLKNWQNKNYDTILSNLNINDNTFTSKDQFSKTFQDLEEFSILDFQINNCKIKKEKNATCTVSYQINKNGPYYEKTYNLEKQEKKRLFLFENWFIQNEKLETIKELDIYIPKESSAKLMGIDLKPYLKEEKEKNGYDCYTLPEVFKGSYNLEIAFNNSLTLEKEITITNQAYTYQFNMKDISLEYRSQMEEMGKNIIEIIYKGIANKMEFQDIKSNYDITKLKNTYEYIKEETKESGLTNFEIKEIKANDIEITAEGKLNITFQINYEYDLKYQNNTQETTHHGKSSDTFYITTKNTELKEIEEIASIITYFSKKY